MTAVTVSNRNDFERYAAREIIRIVGRERRILRNVRKDSKKF